MFSKFRFHSTRSENMSHETRRLSLLSQGIIAWHKYKVRAHFIDQDRTEKALRTNSKASKKGTFALARQIIHWVLVREQTGLDEWTERMSLSSVMMIERKASGGSCKSRDSRKRPILGCSKIQ